MARCWITIVSHAAEGTSTSARFKFVGSDVPLTVPETEHQCDYSAGSNFTAIDNAIRACGQVLADLYGVTVANADFLVPQFS